MAEIATLGIIVDASGARREIKLTRDELIALANGGRLAQAAMKTVIPPHVVPPSAPAEINRVTEAITRMRQAAAQGQANAMASQIGLLDPFQKTAAVAQKATLNFNGMRGALTQLAVSASGLPGPLGRLAGILGQFAFGGAITVGVLAGAAAIAIAWEKMTEKSRAAKAAFEKHLDVLRELKKQQDLGITGEAGAATAAGQGRLATLRGEMSPINDLIAGAKGAGAWDYAGALERRRKVLIDEYVKLEALVRSGERNVTKVLTESAREREAQMLSNRPMRDAFESWAGTSYNKAPGTDALIADYAKRLADASDEHQRFVTSATDMRDATAGFNAELAETIRLAVQSVVAFDTAKQKKDNRERALQSTAFGALGGIASRLPGAAGGIIGGAVGGIGGGAPGMAAGALGGLVDSILNAGDAARAAAQHLRQFQRSFQSFIDSIDHELGRMSDPDFAEAQTRRQFDEERERIRAEAEREKDAISPWTTRWHKEKRGKEIDAEAQKRIDELNRREKELTEHRRKEADEIDRINNAVRNAPSGFYVEKYLRRLGASGGGSVPIGGGPGPQIHPRTDGGAGSGGGGGHTFNLTGATFTLEGDTPLEVFEGFIKLLREKAAATGGAGMPLSDALDLN